MKYLLVDSVSETIVDWVIVAMPKTAKGEKYYETDEDAGFMYSFGNFENYEGKHYNGRLFKNLKSLKQFLRASRDWELGSSCDIEAYRECSHWINFMVNAYCIKRDTEKEGGLNGTFYWDENLPEEGQFFPPKLADEEL
tara:strand:+ start:308 stop:724 length:417 start_codon:yes stop_codon:yes gene_type:complete